MEEIFIVSSGLEPIKRRSLVCTLSTPPKPKPSVEVYAANGRSSLLRQTQYYTVITTTRLTKISSPIHHLAKDCPEIPPLPSSITSSSRQSRQ